MDDVGENSPRSIMIAVNDNVVDARRLLRGGI